MLNSRILCSIAWLTAFSISSSLAFGANLEISVAAVAVVL